MSSHNQSHFQSSKNHVNSEIGNGSTSKPSHSKSEMSTLTKLDLFRWRLNELSFQEKSKRCEMRHPIFYTRPTRSQSELGVKVHGYHYLRGNSIERVTRASLKKKGSNVEKSHRSSNNDRGSSVEKTHRSSNNDKGSSVERTHRSSNNERGSSVEKAHGSSNNERGSSVVTRTNNQQNAQENHHDAMESQDYNTDNNYYSSNEPSQYYEVRILYQCQFE